MGVAGDGVPGVLISDEEAEQWSIIPESDVTEGVASMIAVVVVVAVAVSGWLLDGRLLVRHDPRYGCKTIKKGSCLYLSGLWVHVGRDCLECLARRGGVPKAKSEPELRSRMYSSARLCS